MKASKILVLTLILVTVTSVLLTGCASDVNNSTDEVKGSILLYTSQPDADAQALVDAFTKEYPDANVEIFRSGTEEVISKLLAEKEAGSVMADVLLVADSVTFERLKAQDGTMSRKSTS